MYSRASVSGHSKIGTLYNRPLYKGHTKIIFPIALIHFEPLKEDNLCTKDKTAELIFFPSVSFIQRFHCTTTTIVNDKTYLKHGSKLIFVQSIPPRLRSDPCNVVFHPLPHHPLISPPLSTQAYLRVRGWGLGCYIPCSS